jgi:hypothetical protein
MSIEAMRQALEALERADKISGYANNQKAIYALRQAIEQAEKQEPVAIGEEWKPCVKLPVVVHVREQRKGETHVSTREGITPVKEDDLIMRGVAGEEYPIGRELFNRTYTFDTAPVHAIDISQERVDETEKDRHEPVAWLDGGLGVFYWACEFKDKPVPPGFEPLYAAYPRYWSNVTDDALIEEVRHRGFIIRDAQISPKKEWVGLTDEDLLVCDEDGVLLARYWEAKLKEKNGG